MDRTAVGMYQESLAISRNAVVWYIGAIAVLALAPISISLGLNLMPSMGIALNAGTIVPWAATWVFIGITVAIAVALSGFLVATGLRMARRAR